MYLICVHVCVYHITSATFTICICTYMYTLCISTFAGKLRHLTTTYQLKKIILDGAHHGRYIMWPLFGISTRIRKWFCYDQSTNSINSVKKPLELWVSAVMLKVHIRLNNLFIQFINFAPLVIGTMLINVTTTHHKWGKSGTLQLLVN